jgi:hypothetical protein
VAPGGVPDSLECACAAGRIVSITKAAWLLGPPGYLGWGAPPPTRDVEAWMRQLDHPYYVGLLAAAAHHASHVFHVITSARLGTETM